MRKYLYPIGILFVFFLQQSCSIQSMMSLQPYHQKIQITNEIPASEQVIIKVSSNLSYFYYDLFEWEESENDNSGGYTIYVVDVGQKVQSDDDTDFTIELNSVEVTECGNPLPFSIFQKTYPGMKNPELIETPYVERDCKSHKFFIKIQKPKEEIREVTIIYNIEVNGIPVINVHKYRTQFSVETKHHTIFKFWVCNCKL